MKKVLVAEDEASIRECVVINLERAGYTVLQAQNGEEALALYEQQGDDLDVAVLDIMMPVVDGIEVCRQLRAKSPHLGIIFLTAKTQEMDKVTGLLTGADDYVTKPFSVSELMARVESIYRRVEMTKVGRHTGTVITCGDFTLDLRSRTLKKGDRPIELTQVEFQITEFFFRNAGAALSRVEILHHVWGTEYFGEEKIVDVNIRRLRMKIEDDPGEPEHLLTVWGVGYKWMA